MQDHIRTSPCLMTYRHYFIFQYTGVFIVYIHAELNFIGSRSPLFMGNGPKAEENAHTATGLLHVLQDLNLTKFAHFCIFLYILLNTMCYHTLFHYLYVSVASVICASKSRTSAMLLVLNIGN
jgi:hypothetical protein